MGAVPTGPRRLVVADVAAWLQSHEPPIEISPEALRIAIGSYRFLKEIEQTDKALALRMRALSATAVKWTMGWYRRDPDGASAAIIDLIEGRLSLQGLRLREIAARRGAPEEGRVASNVAKDWWKTERVLTDFEVCWPVEAACEIWQPSLLVPSIGRATALGSLTLASKTRQGRRLPWKPLLTYERGDKKFAVFPDVGLFVVGPYADTTSEKGRVADWCLRILGATFYYKLVALVLQHDSDIHRYARLLSEKGKLRSPRVMILRPQPTPSSTPRRA